ncbi:MAG: sugar phosphate isomerase/epimerase family protein [Victivallales bacterium]|jgi:sugar phosphate isomerase/epimerase
MFKIGLSSYSLSKAMNAGEMDILGAIMWISENGGEHMELSPGKLVLAGDDALVKAIVKKAADCGIALSSYTIGANFITETEDAFQKEIKRVKSEVDIAAALGVKRMRHDAGSRPPADATVANFEKDLPKLVEACRTVADYAEKYGIVTSVENHGYHVQGSERVQRLVLAVDRENFRTTVDIGNFLCADEDPVSAVMNNIGLASMVHFKDFYRRPPQSDLGDGWFKSKAGYFLRGSIVGQGDIDIPSVVKIIKNSGYDGFISIEFEGMEDCRTGSKIGLQNLRRYFEIL